MIMVDSSVWIDYFNGYETPETTKLDLWLGIQPISIGDIILTEVLQPRFRTSKCSIKKYIVLKSPKIIPGQEYFSFH